VLEELEDLAAKLRHAIARNPEHSEMEQLELEDVKQWIAIRQNRDELRCLSPNCLPALSQYEPVAHKRHP
jgi:hypothetical protein